jgi:PadR family transcriptional regulator PadR
MQDDVSSQVNAWKSQIKKGTLELAILALLASKRSYGLELLEQLNELDLEISEGSIYPVLSRLRNEKKVTANWVDEAAGHSHKFYSLTPYGRQILGKMIAAWGEYTKAINGAIGKVHPHE